ncbi:MAG: hypothetical protein K9N10_07015 [Deltaproteobacteria bacterium]|nr:hypothetical protein [Deltaproteobacteria bacterium]
MMPIFQKPPFFGISKFVHWGLPVLFILCLWVDPPLAAEPKTELLSKKMGQLTNMQEKAAKKLLLASKIFENLNHRMDELRLEIFEIQKRAKIVSYTDAVRSPRIKHNLLLLAQLQVYCIKLAGRIEKLKSSRARLNFLHQRLEDDLKIIETVNLVETAGLLERVDETINGDAWLDQPHVIEVEGAVLPAPLKIWQDFIVKK